MTTGNLNSPPATTCRWPSTPCEPGRDGFAHGLPRLSTAVATWSTSNGRAGSSQSVGRASPLALAIAAIASRISNGTTGSVLDSGGDVGSGATALDGMGDPTVVATRALWAPSSSPNNQWTIAAV